MGQLTEDQLQNIIGQYLRISVVLQNSNIKVVLQFQFIPIEGEFDYNLLFYSSSVLHGTEYIMVLRYKVPSDHYWDYK